MNEGAECVGVGHAGGDPGVDAVGGVDGSVVVEPACAAAGGGEAFAEGEEVVAELFEECEVVLCAEAVGFVCARHCGFLSMLKHLLCW